MKITDNITLIVTVALVVAAGMGIGFMVTNSAANNHPSGSSSAYDLNLVITTNNFFNNATGDQPAFYVLGSNGLVSSANISIPAFTQIVCRGTPGWMVVRRTVCYHKAYTHSSRNNQCDCYNQCYIVCYLHCYQDYIITSSIRSIAYMSGKPLSDKGDKLNTI